MSPPPPSSSAFRDRVFLAILAGLFALAAGYLVRQPAGDLTAAVCAFLALTLLSVSLLAPSRWARRVAGWCYGWP